MSDAAQAGFTNWPPARRIEANGICLSVHGAGPVHARPPIVFCHGFPEIAFSWRHQLAALSQRGFRVLAPDQRGYGASSAPKDAGAYQIETLCADMVGLLDAEGIESAVFCGHDWGGFIVWEMARRHPQRVAGVISLNTPYLPRAPIDPIAILEARFGPDMYIVYFQRPAEAEALFEADINKTIRYFFRRTEVFPEMFAARPKAQTNLAFQHALVRFDGTKDTQQLLSAAERAAYVAAFARSGFHGPVNWYRNISGNWQRSAGLKEQIDQPCLMIMAQNDVVLPPSAAEGMESRIPRLEKVLIEGCGHWTQQEKPEIVNALIADWMGRTFPA
jgi:pimeloyl-ACP methyl ester carboxylesterase